MLKQGVNERCGIGFVGSGFGFPSIGGWWHSRDVKKRRVIAVVAGGVVAIILAVAFWPREREPEYGGKKLSEWLMQYRELSDHRHSDDPELRQASDAVRHFGTNALPFLLAWLHQERSSWDVRLTVAVEKLPLQIQNRILPHIGTSRTRCEIAVIGFEILGSKASPAVPELKRLAADTNANETARRAWLCLSLIGVHGVIEP